MTKPCELSALEARRLIGQKKLSPVELMDSCLDQIEATNKTFNSVCAMDEKAAKKQAKAAEKAVMSGDALGILHGLPVGIKDLHAVQGLRSTVGISDLQRQHPQGRRQYGCQCARRWGIGVCDDQRCREFGAGANTRNRVYGPTGNAFQSHSDGCGFFGWRGGGAGAQSNAAGDWIRLRRLIAYAGRVCRRRRLSPSVGLVPSPDKVAGLIPWGVTGPMGRTVDDAYLLFRAQLDCDERDPFSSTIPMTSGCVE